MREYTDALKALFIETWEAFKNLPQIVADWLDELSARINAGLDTDLGDGDYEDIVIRGDFVNIPHDANIAIWSSDDKNWKPVTKCTCGGQIGFNQPPCPTKEHARPERTMIAKFDGRDYGEEEN